MKFRKGNQYCYGQDFNFWRGVPHGVDFELYSFSYRKGDENVTKIKMIAPGYGGKPYGNGAIYLYVSMMRKVQRERMARELKKALRLRE